MRSLPVVVAPSLVRRLGARISVHALAIVALLAQDDPTWTTLVVVVLLANTFGGLADAYRYSTSSVVDPTYAELRRAYREAQLLLDLRDQRRDDPHGHRRI